MKLAQIDYLLHHHLPFKVWKIYLDIIFRYWRNAFERSEKRGEKRLDERKSALKMSESERRDGRYCVKQQKFRIFESMTSEECFSCKDFIVNCKMGL